MSQPAAASRPSYSLTTVDVLVASLMLAFHIVAFASLFFFSWTNLLVALVLHWMVVGFGISLGYHRLHTHRGYKTSKPVEYAMAWLGAMVAFYAPYLSVALFVLMLGRDLLSTEPLRPAWLSSSPSAIRVSPASALPRNTIPACAATVRSLPPLQT